MRTARLLGLGSILFACSGCVVSSLHPLYGPGTEKVSLPLEGSWVDKTGRLDDSGQTWTISPHEKSEGTYEIRITGEQGASWTCFAFAFRLGDHVFLDTTADLKNVGPGAIIGHQVFRLRRWEEGFVLERCVPKKMKAAIEKGAAISAEETEWGFVLTSKTPALQAFFKDHADEVFGERMYLRRRAEKAQ